MQNDETTPASHLSSKDLTPCPCSACFPRKDFCSDSLGLAASHPRELYNYNRVAGFPPTIPVFRPYAPISSSSASLYGPIHLHRPGYPRTMFPAPDGRYDLSVMQEAPNKDGTFHERQMVHSPSLHVTESEASASYWEQTSGSGLGDKPRRMRTVFTPQQLERLERHFKSQQYVGSAQRIYIAKQLGLSETQVKVWFQNRRIRWRKQALGTVAKSQ